MISTHPDITDAIQTIADRVALHQDFAEIPGYADHIAGEVRDRICTALDKEPLPTYAEWSAIERLLDAPSGEAPARERVIA